MQSLEGSAVVRAETKSPLTMPLSKPKATWVKPSFMAEVEYRDITSEGLLRQSSFKGLTKSAQRADAKVNGSQETCKA